MKASHREMTKRIVVATVAGLMALMLVVGLVLSPILSVSAAGNPTLTCTTADSWSSLFDRRNSGSQRTWLGADGIYSIPLDGNDSFGSAGSNSNTFFIFSDTITGTANGNGQVSNYRMPNNTAARLIGDQPNNSNLSFYLGKGNNGNVEQNLFVDYRCWMLDGFVSGGYLWLFGFQPNNDWKPGNVELFKVPLSNGLPNWGAYGNYNQTVNVPQLWAKTSDYVYCFGIGITCNTSTAGAPNPDGYIYFYGYRDAVNEWSRKDLICARIRESDLNNFSNITYWNGSGWSSNIYDSAVLISNVSCEMSVSPITVGPYSGKYIAVYTEGTESANMMYAIGDSLTGPFNNPVCFYQAPEHNTTGTCGRGTRYTYNAKAHPTLSDGTKLLVSYNVNIRCDSSADQWTVDYYPRFLWLDLDPVDARPTTLTSSVYSIYNNMVRIPAGTTPDQLRAGLNERDYVNLNVKGDTISTGMTLTLSEAYEYSIVVIGDVDGDGAISATDLTKEARHVSRIERLTASTAIAAADLDNDRVAGARDLTALARAVANIE